MHKIFFSFVLVLVISASCFAGAYIPDENVSPKITSIKQILSSPKYLNTVVAIKGIYRGWGALEGPPPVTKSDYVIEDNGYKIYATGPLPLGMSMKSVGQTMTIKAKVRSVTLDVSGNKKQIIYLEVM